MSLQVTVWCIGHVSTNECCISLVTSNCEGTTSSSESTTMSFGLNKLDIETQGCTEFRNPQALW